MAQKLFESKATNSISIMIESDMGNPIDIDAHGAAVAQNIPVSYEKIFAGVVAIIKYLSETNLTGSDKKLLDVTTLMISSEFSRTYYDISYKPEVWDQGTGHNPFTNSFVFLGKGIKGGRIIGSSDLDTIENCKPDKISKAHQTLTSADKGANPKYSMGREFDFATGKTITDVLPEKFDVRRYITTQVLTNTVLELFGIDKSQHFRDSTGNQFLTLRGHLTEVV